MVLDYPGRCSDEVSRNALAVHQPVKLIKISTDRLRGEKRNSPQIGRHVLDKGTPLLVFPHP